jgi:hypothetical protein
MKGLAGERVETSDRQLVPSCCPYSILGNVSNDLLKLCTLFCQAVDHRQV